MPQTSEIWVKAHLILAQFMPVAMLVELFARHSIWLLIPAILLILTIGLYRCGNCGTRLVDPRVIGRKCRFRLASWIAAGFAGSPCSVSANNRPSRSPHSE